MIRDDKGNPILVMMDNDWTAYSRDLFDLRCSAQGKELEIISNDGSTYFKMRFDDYSQTDFKKLLSRHTSERNIDWFISSIGEPKTIPTWGIKGKLKWGNSYLEIKDFEIIDLLRHNVLRMNWVVGSQTAFSFRTSSMGIG